ncbi:transposase [Streptomyces viridosporus ATCC 14672]|uniref:Transposase n=1 Tax=Streptomyces viridosporus (strain ATCC 14672 / DSM 40746 / JCM 4963 / KCTC 9882 / NRRL B-12104 / FH 1290) TaxID=566461 RepID=D6A9V3_STRV1|nr:transposase [Streptomyces viridosporus ATCC 14672]
MRMSCAADPGPGDTRHLDEVFITVNGERHYPWRAAGRHGNVLDILLQPQRDTPAAVRFFRRLPMGPEDVPRVMVTDKPRSYRAAHRQVMPGAEHRTSKCPNNRAENSQRPTRQRERAMKGFCSVGGAEAVPVRVPRRLAALPAPPPPDDGPRLPRRDDRPLRRLGPGHRRRRPAHHGPSTGPEAGPSPCPDAPSETQAPNNVTAPSPGP